VVLATSPTLEHGPSSAASTLQNYKIATLGARFLIAEDGTVYPAAGLDQTAAHVGKFRPKGYSHAPAAGHSRDNYLLYAVSQAMLKNKKQLNFGAVVTQLSAHEASKPYGSNPLDATTRLPINSNSIGIKFEVVADKDNRYKSLTDAQKASGAALIQLLQTTYGLTATNIYEHPDISYKNDTEEQSAKTLIEAC
jgi:N-acetyl-anhydromuramyl-L-alanine amidase AmpD